jgi:hypothetical protein
MLMLVIVSHDYWALATESSCAPAFMRTGASKCCNPTRYVRLCRKVTSQPYDLISKLPICLKRPC